MGGGGGKGSAPLNDVIGRRPAVASPTFVGDVEGQLL